MRKPKRLTLSTYLPTHWLASSFFNSIQWEVSCVWCSWLLETPVHSLPAFVPPLSRLWKCQTRMNWLDIPCQRFGMNWCCKWCQLILTIPIAHLLLVLAATPAHILRRSLRWWIEYSMPYLFAAGESVIEMVTYDEHQVFKAIFLPEVCTLPTGTFWPTTTSCKDFLWSLACLQPAFCQVVEVLQHLGDQVHHWFEAVNDDCTSFRLLKSASTTHHPPNLSLLHWWELQLGIHPVCQLQFFSDDRNDQKCFLWRLQLDTHLLSSSSKAARQALEHCFDSGAASLKISSKFLPPNINPWVCPNFANHFAVKGGWLPSITQSPPYVPISRPGQWSGSAVQSHWLGSYIQRSIHHSTIADERWGLVWFTSESAMWWVTCWPKTIRASSSGAVLP